MKTKLLALLLILFALVASSSAAVCRRSRSSWASELRAISVVACAMSLVCDASRQVMKARAAVAIATATSIHAPASTRGG